METFSILFYTFMYKFILSYEKSDTLKTRLLWLTVDTPTSTLPKYFKTKSSGVKSHLNVSMETLLEAFRQLRKACVVERQGESREERERQGEEELRKLLTQKDMEIKEVYLLHMYMFLCVSFYYMYV